MPVPRPNTVGPITRGLNLRGWASLTGDRTCRVSEPPGRHVCNAYCRESIHADLAYYHGHGDISVTDMERVATHFRPGYRILSVQLAAEAPIPDGYETAWLVTYLRPAA